MNKLPYLGLMLAMTTNVFSADPAKVRKIYDYISAKGTEIKVNLGYGMVNAKYLPFRLTEDGKVVKGIKINAIVNELNGLENFMLAQTLPNKNKDNIGMLLVTDTAKIGGHDFDGKAEGPYIVFSDGSQIKRSDFNYPNSKKDSQSLLDRLVETVKISGEN
nr:hypothetical protein [Candidatus Woesearchaeota archaeon]